MLTFVATATAVLSASSPPQLVADVLYGDDRGLDISCAADELIHIQSETLAYSGGSERNSSTCRPTPMCSVPYFQVIPYWRYYRGIHGITAGTGIAVEIEILGNAVGWTGD